MQAKDQSADSQIGKISSWAYLACRYPVVSLAVHASANGIGFSTCNEHHQPAVGLVIQQLLIGIWQLAINQQVEELAEELPWPKLMKSRGACMGCRCEILQHEALAVQLTSNHSIQGNMGHHTQHSMSNLLHQPVSFYRQQCPV